MLCMPTLLASLHLGLVTPSRPTAAVIGGGPAGLAAAYTLAERNFDVSIFEQRPQSSMYEAQKAYLYLIDGRGQRFTNAAGLADELSSPENSVSSLNYTVTRCMPDGSRVAVVPPILEPSTSPSWWIPRQRFLALLVGAIKRLNGRRDPSTDRQSTGRVELFFGSEVLGVSRTASGGVEVHARTEDGGETTVQPLLLVGADGINSLVRRRCAEWSEADATWARAPPTSRRATCRRRAAASCTRCCACRPPSASTARTRPSRSRARRTRSGQRRARRSARRASACYPSPTPTTRAPPTSSYRRNTPCGRWRAAATSRRGSGRPSRSCPWTSSSATTRRRTSPRRAPGRSPHRPTRRNSTSSCPPPPSASSATASPRSHPTSARASTARCPR